MKFKVNFTNLAGLPEFETTGFPKTLNKDQKQRKRLINMTAVITSRNC
jgi:hypothetical protein